MIKNEAKSLSLSANYYKNCNTRLYLSTVAWIINLFSSTRSSPSNNASELGLNPDFKDTCFSLVG